MGQKERWERMTAEERKEHTARAREGLKKYTPEELKEFSSKGGKKSLDSARATEISKKGVAARRRYAELRKKASRE